MKTPYWCSWLNRKMNFHSSLVDWLLASQQVTDNHRHNWSSTSHVKPSHSLSYPRISSWKAHPRPLVSVQSEGATTIGQSQKLSGFIERKPVPPLPSSRTEDHVHGDSSEEDELIVRIDSPSGLSFRRSSGHLSHQHTEGWTFCIYILGSWHIMCCAASCVLFKIEMNSKCYDF